MPEKKTGAQQNEEASLLEKIQAIKNAPKSSDLKAKLDPEANKRLVESYKKMHQDAFARVKGSRLAESYLEYERSQQELDIDVSKYTDENARKTVQAIIDSGLGDNSNSFKHFVDLIAQVSARHKTIFFDLTDNTRLYGTEHSRTGLTTNGYKLTDENGTTIVINKDAAKPLRVVVGHEFAHVLEKSGFYEAMADTALKFAELKEGTAGLKARLDEAERIYKDDTNTTPEKEVVADIIGEYVFTDYEFIRNLAKTNHQGFMKLFDEIKYLARVATAGSEVYRELARLKNDFERAYREYNGANSKAESDSGNTQAEGLQNASDLAGRQDVTFNHIGINDKQTRQKWIDAGLASIEQGADGDTYVAVNDAMLMDERERRQKNTVYSLENGNKRKYNKRGKSWYSQSETEFMRFESGSAKVGDVRSFNRFGKTRYYEKTESGCVELSRKQYNERVGVDVRADYKRAKSEIGEAVNYDESTGRGLSGYNDSYRDTGADEVVFGQALREEFSDVAPRSVSSTDGYNRGTDVTEYDEEASGYPGASITFGVDYQYHRNRMKEGDTGESDVHILYLLSKR